MGRLRRARARTAALWRRVPAPARIVLVTLLGAALIATGLALVVLPGPFTLPLVLAGTAVLASEFPWAARALHRANELIGHAWARVRGWSSRPALRMAAILAVSSLVALAGALLIR